MNNEKKGFGFHQWCNFGSKHKGRSVYDIANVGDFDYLRFLSKANTQRKNNFYLTDEFLVHVNHAIQTRGTNAKWERVMCDADDNGISNMYYFTTINNKRIESSPIPYATCEACGKSRNACVIIDHLCYSCRQNVKSPAPGVPQKANNFQKRW